MYHLTITTDLAADHVDQVQPFTPFPTIIEAMAGFGAGYSRPSRHLADVGHVYDASVTDDDGDTVATWNVRRQTWEV